MPDKNTKRLPFKRNILFAVFCLFAADQLTKYAVSIRIPQGKIIHLIWGFGLTYATNRGLALHLFAQYKLTGIIAATAGILFVPILILYYRRYVMQIEPSVWLKMTFVLILSGILGNSCDRVFLGYVRDFILWPGPGTPNLADLYIDSGVICLLVELLKNRVKFGKRF
jgi:signal peptidase II